MPRKKLTARPKPPGADAAPIKVILNKDRCVPGQFIWPGGKCDILGRGTTGTNPALAANPQYQKGKNVNGKPCFYLKEEYNEGATPIPSKGFYTIAYRGKDIGPPGGDHWAQREKKDGKIVKDAKGREILIPVPTFQLGLRNGNTIPSTRGIESLLMHPHGKYEDLPLTLFGTHGCLKPETKCIWDFYAWMEKERFPTLDLAIWEQ